MHQNRNDKVTTMSLLSPQNPEHRIPNTEYRLIVNRFILLIALTIFIATIYASDIDKNAGEKGFLFLQIPSSPELAGMANTGDMFHSSPVNMLHHPAAFDWQRGKSIAFSQSIWLVDTYLYHIAYRNVWFDKSFGLAIKYMDYGQFDKREDNGTLIGSYYPMDLQLAGNYAMKLTPNITAGINASILYEKIDTSSAVGFTTDMGMVYYTPLANTTLDLALKNIGTTGKMDETKIELPFTAEIGAATAFEINDQTIIYPALKLVYMNDHDDILPAVGVSVKLFDMLYLRTGYKFNYNEEDFSAGVGVTYKHFTVDYAFLNNSIDGVDAVHKIGLTYRF